MKAVFFTAALAALVAAHPLESEAAPAKRQDIDTTVLNFALTLEHLEARFYADGLSQFDAAAFESCGFPDWVRGRISQIADHEANHVAFLTSVLGSSATAECSYNFPYTDPTSFVALATILEQVGSSAYTGAAQLLTDKGYLTAAAAILSTEARHQAWLASAAQTGYPWSTGYETPLDGDQVYTLAAAFITSCPDSNPALPFKAFPAVTVSGTVAAGSTVQLSFDAGGVSGPYYGAFFSGLNTEYAMINDDATVTIPTDLVGTVFMVVTTNGTAVTDNNTIAGVAVLPIPYDQSAPGVPATSS
ncbi:hypothetical protein CALCODRAFT_452609 [Calocera cornea HHB12733]|uniref:Ferritin-like domain-containing protein n=1 Tax=Calocera cornea HHB12733 TaxID=1353952 RepID=A0A165G8S4_9BASI|nr:hypothetical protein CALCODRAFT_452609 [Calocera cornea HHB12733]